MVLRRIPQPSITLFLFDQRGPSPIVSSDAPVQLQGPFAPAYVRSSVRATEVHPAFQSLRLAKFSVWYDLRLVRKAAPKCAASNAAVLKRTGASPAEDTGKGISDNV